MVRVLYVLDRDEMQGGVAQAIELIIRHGKSLGLRAAVITPHAGSDSELAMRKAGADAFSFGRPFTYSKVNPVGSLRALFQFATKLKQVVAEFKPDVIETNHATAEAFTSLAQALTRNSLPRVFCQRGNLRIYRGKVSGAALRLALRSISAVITVSPFPGDEYARILGVPSEKVVYISDCTEMHRRQPNPSDKEETDCLRDSWRDKTNDVLVGIVGTILPNKNQSLLIEAARRIRRDGHDARFIVVGNRDNERYYNELVARVNDYGLRDHVVFAGFVDKHKAIPALDIVVSLSQYEGFGLNIIEAAACGKPVVATRSGGPEYILQDGRSGFLIANDDVHMLTERLTTLIDDSVLRDTMGREGREMVRRDYDPVDKIEARLSLYERLMKGP